MFASRFLQKRAFYLVTFTIILTVLLFAGMIHLASAANASSLAASQQGAFFSISGTLGPGEAISPASQQARDFNFSLTVTGTSPVSMTVKNGTGTLIWVGDILGGETVWGTGTLTNGFNPFHLTNTGSTSVDFELNLYDLPTAGYDWTGLADAAGLNSHIRVIFPSDGLYTFDLGEAGSGRYQFSLDSNYIQKTVELSSTVTYFVAAGTYDLSIDQDSSSGADWNVSISDVGSASDSLPYTKVGGDIGGTGNDFTMEWLPINLAAPTEVNLEVTLSGTSGDTASLQVFDAADSEIISTTVYASESHWVSFDLPAGTSRFELNAHPTNTDALTYDLALSALPSPSFTWSGVADAAGQNSHARVFFPSDGLYTFALGEAGSGRYQFFLDTQYIQKTVEGATSVTYFVTAGTHDLIIDQDSSSGADWSVGFSGPGAANNSLPYTKMGGDIGSPGNDFDEELLPINLGADTQVNLEITLSGDVTDSLSLEVWDSTSQKMVLSQVFGTETLWTTTLMPASARIHLVADSGNAQPMAYDLSLSSIPGNGTTTWDGYSLASGITSTIMVDFPTTDLYHFEIESADGFANLVLDDALSAQRLSPTSLPDLLTGYDVNVTAGMHRLHVIQDTSFSATDWSASVAPVSASDSFFTFEGTLASGEIVTPEYTVPSGMLDFNFSLAVSNGPVDLIITDGDGTQVWNDTALTGETLWGTGSLKDTNQLMLTNNSGGDVDVFLTLYHLPTVSYDWTGLADAAGLNSHIRVIFPSDGLYTFDLGEAGSGRYQFSLDSNYIQKTVELSSTVTYFVAAGTYDLSIDQDSSSGADWNVSISDVGSASDSLPYTKVGGDIGGTGNDFTMEWLPINLAAPTEVNLEVTLSGTSGDTASLQVFDAADSEIISTTVYASESHWVSFDLPAGTSRFELNAHPTNTDALTYDLALSALPSPSFTWSGVADAAGQNSHARVFFPSDGLYTFALGEAGSGRYQFFLDTQYIQKTVEGATSVTYFVTSGTHDLIIDQDSSSGADWSVGISGPGAANDSLPYTKMGGDIGSPSNDFDEEWLPINLGADTQVNLEITLSGDVTDSLSLEVWDSTSQKMVLSKVFGTETLWATTLLPANARIHLVADSSNLQTLSYDIKVHSVPQIPHVWSGASLENGLNSTIQIEAPVSGLYHVDVYMPEGFTTVLIDQPTTRLARPDAPGQFSYGFDVSLTAGSHSVTGVQAAGFPRTSWTITATLLQADPPSVTAITPDTTFVSLATPVTIDGDNFMMGVSAKLVSGGIGYPLTSVTFVSRTQLTAEVSTMFPLGTYDVVVTNSDTQTGTLPAGFSIILSNPTITSITPDNTFINMAAAVSINGTEFLPGATAKLVSGSDEYPLTSVNYVSSTLLTAIVPDTVPAGTYDLVVTNSTDLQEATLANGFLVKMYLIYLPIIANN